MAVVCFLIYSLTVKTFIFTVPALLAVQMDYIKEYKSFINSYYVSEGVRVTAGIALPALVLGYFNLLPVGMVVSLGAMCVSVADSPGPAHHRSISMRICAILIFFVALCSGFASNNDIVLGFLITLFSFLFSMIGVYGNRAISIGVSALLVMILTIAHHLQGLDVLINALYVLAGGVWYFLLSMILYTFRPYKLPQQALGDYILATAAYMRTRAAFYKKEADYENIYMQMLQVQGEAQEKQNFVRELLFKSRSIVKESTDTGRILVMIFLDTVDLFERAMTSYQDYKTLHIYFDDSDMLEQLRLLILEVAQQLDDIGIAVKSGSASVENNMLQQHINSTEQYLNIFINEKRKPENIEQFISLRHILQSIQDIASRVSTLHIYTTYDRKLVKKFPTALDYERFITHQEVSLQLLNDNLTLKSNTFRHAIRVSIAMLAGYLISKLLPLGHSYWILLTVLVILKPAYSLTKKRNYQRLLGTIAGALMGLLLLYLIQDNTILFLFMILLMIATYSFIRTNYLLSVLFMTPYILLLFHLLNKGGIETVISDRIIDTAIGSAIAFLANFFLVPSWQQEQIKEYINTAVEGNTIYFKHVSAAFTGKPVSVTEYKLSRKNAFVSLANLSDAFSGMLSEPKNKQKNILQVHQLVVLNHMLTSHIATLSYYVKPLSAKYASVDFEPVIDAILNQLGNTKKITGKESPSLMPYNNNDKLLLDEQVNTLIQKRRDELKLGLADTDTRKTLSELKSVMDQFNFIRSITTDINKITREISTR